MSTSISSTSSATLSNALFDKLDTQKKGYIDIADMQAATAPGSEDSKTAEAFAAIDTDSDGKVSKSELSTAIDKVGEQLNAQRDAARVKAGGAQGQGHAGGPPPGGGAGGARPASSSDREDSTTKYVAAADTNGDGTVSEAEEAAYEQLQAAAAKAQSQVAQYKTVGAADCSGAAASTAIDVSAWLPGRRLNLPNAELALHGESVAQKMEASAAFDFVREAVKQPHARPLVTIAIRADGSIEKVSFMVSSGVPALDEAICKANASQAPFGSFPMTLARQYDVIEMRRTWVFDEAIWLQ